MANLLFPRLLNASPESGDSNFRLFESLILPPRSSLTLVKDVFVQLYSCRFWTNKFLFACIDANRIKFTNSPDYFRKRKTQKLKVLSWCLSPFKLFVH